MNKLTALHKFLTEQNQFDENMLESWAEKATLVPSGRNITVGTNDMQGIELGLVQYDAIFVIENYKGGAFELMAQVFIWLSAHDDNREQFSLAAPDFEVAPLDNGRVDIEINLPFLEPLNLVRDDDAGTVLVDGTKYRIETPEIYFAESAEVRTANELPNGGQV